MANVAIAIATNPTDLTGRPAVFDGAYRGRRLSWAEFYKLRPDLRPDNDNRAEGGTSDLSDDARPGTGAGPSRTFPRFKIWPL